MNFEYEEKLKKFGDYKRKETLKRHTTIKIGGPAKYYLVIKETQKLIQAVKFALKNNLAYFVIGEGSNLIFSDAGFNGLVIKNETANLVFEKSSAVSDSGITLFRLIRKLAEFNLGGLEFLSGIPGTLGGAIYGNAGAYGKNISDIIENCTILDIDGEIKQFSNQQMGFGYRTSFLKTGFKNQFRKPVIISAQIKISPSPKEAILRLVANFHKIRTKKIPQGFSAGCLFKNLEVKNLPNLENSQLKYLITENKIPAGLLIEKAGGKDLKVGKAEVSKLHANFIINKSRAHAFEVKLLAEKIKEAVKSRFDINLESEVEFVGTIQENKKIWQKLFKR